MKLNNLSVLVIEDNEGDFVLIEDFLIEIYKNVEIQHCRDFTSAKHFLEQSHNKVTAIFLDLNLPDLSGNKLITEVLRLSKDSPVIVLTGYAEIDLAQKSLEMGVDDFLIKDEINPSILQKSIEFSLSRKNLRKQLEVERENYKNLLNLSPQPMWLLDPDSFEVLDVNQSSIETYGYSLEEYKSLSLIDLHPVEERKSLLESLKGNTDTIENCHFTHLKKCGEQIKVELSIKQMEFSSGDNGIIVQSTDITPLINHLQTIKIQNEKLKKIAWTQSHEVRAPLSRIMGIINLIESQKDNPDELYFCLNQLKVSSDELDEIVRKINKESERI